MTDVDHGIAGREAVHGAQVEDLHAVVDGDVPHGLVGLDDVDDGAVGIGGDGLEGFFLKGGGCGCGGLGDDGGDRCTGGGGWFGGVDDAAGDDTDIEGVIDETVFFGGAGADLVIAVIEQHQVAMVVIIPIGVDDGVDGGGGGGVGVGFVADDGFAAAIAGGDGTVGLVGIAGTGVGAVADEGLIVRVRLGGGHDGVVDGQLRQASVGTVGVDASDEVVGGSGGGSGVSGLGRQESQAEGQNGESQPELFEGEVIFHGIIIPDWGICD